MHANYPAFLPDFNKTRICSTEFTKILSNFMKIRLVGDELFHVEERAGGRTDGYDEANSRFLPFCQSP